MKHTFYAEATKTQWRRGIFKGGHCENLHARLSPYGTATSRSDKAKFRFVAELIVRDKRMILDIEHTWLNLFQEDESDNEDSSEDEINARYSDESRKYSKPSDFAENFLNALQQLGISSQPTFYETKEEIYKIVMHHKEIYERKEPANKSILRDYQEEDVTNTIRVFTTTDQKRGYWSIECGLGKTVMSSELIRRLGLRKNIFVVSRTQLLVQAITSFLQYGWKNTQLFYCSSLPIPSHLPYICKVMSKNDLPKDSVYILIVTYDSLKKFKDKHTDITIFDEAHHCVPSSKKEERSGNVFGLYDENIPSTYRLFITGTPKDTPLICAESGETVYTGMSHQEELFGKCLAERNYVFGLQHGYLSPYEVIGIKTTGKDLRNQLNTLKSLFQLHKDTFNEFLDALKEWEEGKSRYLTEYIDRITEDDSITCDLILWYALVADLLLLAIKTKGLRRIISYHTKIKHADLFVTILRTLAPLKLSGRSFTIDSVASTIDQEINQATCAAFRSIEGAEIRILCNVRSLIEGFDAPETDTTVFVDNKWSPIECKQIVGRGNRKDPNHPSKLHRVIVPFIGYEKEVGDTLFLRTTNDYKTVRYVLKHIIPSSDTAMTIQQTVWVPRLVESDTNKKEEEEDTFDTDETECIELSKQQAELHDNEISAAIQTENLAGESFMKARLWTHQLASNKEWIRRCKYESDIITCWKEYRETHTLPKGIPHDPSKMYKEVGWMGWRDYSGLLFRREEMTDIKPNEFRHLLQMTNVPLENMNMTQLQTFIETECGRRIPANPKAKWKLSIYDIWSSIFPEKAVIIKKWNKYPDVVYDLLRMEQIGDAIEFERRWEELHSKYRDLPGIPTEVWGSSFWADYNA